MLDPVGNSPGPDLIVSVTVTLFLMGLPLESTTLASNQASSVASNAARVVVPVVTLTAAGVPEMGRVASCQLENGLA